MGYFTRIASIFLASLIGFLIYYYIVYPLILKNNCWVETENCIKLSYYTHGNSALVNIENSDSWLWYNGDKVYLYGQPLGESCTPVWQESSQQSCSSDSDCTHPPCIEGRCACDPNSPPFQAVYSVGFDSEVTVPSGFECVKDLRCIQHYYKSKGSQKMSTYIRRDDPKNFGVVDILNVLNKQKIVNI